MIQLPWTLDCIIIQVISAICGRFVLLINTKKGKLVKIEEYLWLFMISYYQCLVNITRIESKIRAALNKYFQGKPIFKQGMKF